MNRTVYSMLIVGITAVLAPAAMAQSNSINPVKPIQGFGGGKPDRTSRQPAPPALPGSRAEPTAITPAERSAADLPPTEALFDAINRGDLATARDSLNRGADLNGTNVLGLTPLDLAIDLGRNEISFLLLSLRGGAGYSTTSAPSAAPPPRTPTRAERAAADRKEHAGHQAAARPATPSAPQTARLFANDGGAPLPQAGFLGFDGRR